MRIFDILKKNRGVEHRLSVYPMLHLPGEPLQAKESDYVRYGFLELNARELCQKGIKGNIAELGVWKGNFAELLNRYFPTKKLYLFDTFEGFDERDKGIELKNDFSTTKQNFSETSIEEVMSKMEHPDKVIIKKGWFPETAIDVEDTFALVDLDADLYQPIYEGLKFFYPRMEKGGIIMIHDFNNEMYKGVRQAVEEYCTEQKISYICLPDVWGSAIIVK